MTTMELYTALDHDCSNFYENYYSKDHGPLVYNAYRDIVNYFADCQRDNWVQVRTAKHKLVNLLHRYNCFDWACPHIEGMIRLFADELNKHYNENDSRRVFQ